MSLTLNLPDLSDTVNLEDLLQESDSVEAQINASFEHLDEVNSAIEHCRELQSHITNHGLSKGSLILFEKELKNINIDVTELLAKDNISQSDIDACQENIGESVKKTLIYLKDKILDIIDYISVLWKKYLGFIAIKLRRLKTLRRERLTGAQNFNTSIFETTEFPGWFAPEVQAILTDVKALRSHIEKLKMISGEFDEEKYPSLGFKFTKDGQFIKMMQKNPSDKFIYDISRSEPMTAKSAGWVDYTILQNYTNSIIAEVEASMKLDSKVTSILSGLRNDVRNTDNQNVLTATERFAKLYKDASSVYRKVILKLLSQMVRVVEHIPLYTA